MTTKTKNLGRIIFMVLFSIQFSLLTTSCKYLEGNETPSTDDITVFEPVTESEVGNGTPQAAEILVKDSVEIRKEQVLEIADVEWKSERYKNEYIKLSQPIVENDIVKGTIELSRSYGFFTGTYEKMEGNMYNIIFNKFSVLINGEKTNERDHQDPSTLSIEPIDDGNAILGKWYDAKTGEFFIDEKFIK